MAPTAIVSDIHSNIHALNAVLEDARACSVQRVVCLGDVIGYGAHPIECIDAARTFDFCLRGNHEDGIAGKLDLFNEDARQAALWTRRLLKAGLLAPEEKKNRWQFVQERPRRREEEGAMFVHGSPRNPVWEYLFDFDCADLFGRASDKVMENLALVSEFCFVGHTHVPGVIDDGGRFIHLEALGDPFELETGAKAIVNVGSVGQPRDGDPRASYALFDGRKVTFRRVEYDVAAACQDIIAEPDLPDSAGQRLLQGF